MGGCGHAKGNLRLRVFRIVALSAVFAVSSHFDGCLGVGE